MAQQEQKKEGSDHSGQKVSQFRREAQGVGSQILEKGKEMATDLADYAQEYSTELSDKAEDTIKKHPFPALLAGFGIGCVVGALILRR